VLILIGVGACFGAFVATQRIKESASQAVLIPQTPVSLSEGKPQFQPVKNQRYVYPYSVIPGGVMSREELTSVIGSDPVVAEHYARFAAGQARVIRASETQFMHVSYRLRNKVFWTAKKIRIPKGEALITDGTELARTRCGNMVSAAPQEPVSEEEPTVETFDVPLLTQVEVPELEMPPSIGLGFQDVRVPKLEPYIPVQRPTILPYYYRPLFVAKSDVVVPEPATFGLLAMGLISLITVRLARRK
jgi:hypothetical protein